MNLRDFYQTSMEPNPFVASELDLNFTHIRIYTYISSDQLKSYSGNRERKRNRQRERGRREGESWGYVAWKCEDHKKLIMCSFMDYYFSRSTNTTQQNKEKIALLHPHLSFIT